MKNKRQISLEIPQSAPVDKAACAGLVETIMHDYSRENYTITVSGVDSEAMADLNQRFRNVAGTTDVLTFSLEEEPLEGEIYLNLQLLESAAAAEGTTSEYQLYKLLIHGTLHLLGIHHNSPEEEALNRALTEEYLQRFDIN